jgi:myxalamid-type polyketide synthase MxaE and MxaD
VGCGENLPGQEIVIADRETRLTCADGKVGEIWVRGPSVAGGYYGRPEATGAAFGGYLATGEGPFLRTGDLGFLRDGQLFVTGRLKDVIIIRGRNYYPEDIEHSVNGADAAFRPGFCAAFSIDVQDREQLVVVQEIEPRHRDLDSEAALRTIRRVIAAEHELEVFAIVLAKAGEISKTSSGKTQRSACRARYLSGELEVIARWQAGGEALEDEPRDTESTPAARLVTADEAERWLIQRIATRTGLTPVQVHVTTSFLEFGLGSLDAVEIAAELEQWLGRRMSPTVVYNYPCIATLAEWLAHPPAAEESFGEQDQARLSLADVPPERLLDEVRNMTEEDMQAFILQEMAKQ